MIDPTRREFSPIEVGVEEIRAGRILVVVDDEDRENEGDLVMAADKATPEAVNFMARHGRGIICMPMLGERLDELQIGMMVSDNTAPLGTAFTVSVDARRGVTTGTSAYDRAVTIRTLVDPTTRRRGPRRAPATSSRSARCPAACCAAPATPRPPSTSPASPDAPPPASSARCWTRTAGWRACPT